MYVEVQRLDEDYSVWRDGLSPSLALLQTQQRKGKNPQTGSTIFVTSTDTLSQHRRLSADSAAGEHATTLSTLHSQRSD